VEKRPLIFPPITGYIQKHGKFRIPSSKYGRLNMDSPGTERPGELQPATFEGMFHFGDLD
jgi:hypothetical protein